MSADLLAEQKLDFEMKPRFLRRDDRRVTFRVFELISEVVEIGFAEIVEGVSFQQKQINPYGETGRIRHEKTIPY